MDARWKRWLDQAALERPGEMAYRFAAAQRAEWATEFFRGKHERSSRNGTDPRAESGNRDPGT
jgi:hypothetical protein